MSNLRMLYGVTISDSIKRGNQDEMTKLLGEAREVLSQQGDLSKAVSDLEKAVGGGHGPIRPLYGAPISDALKRGDRAEMTKLLDEARSAHKQQGDLGAAIKELESALKKK